MGTPSCVIYSITKGLRDPLSPPNVARKHLRLAVDGLYHSSLVKEQRLNTISWIYDVFQGLTFIYSHKIFSV